MWEEMDEVEKELEMERQIEYWLDNDYRPDIRFSDREGIIRDTLHSVYEDCTLGNLERAYNRVTDDYQESRREREAIAYEDECLMYSY